MQCLLEMSQQKKKKNIQQMKEPLTQIIFFTLGFNLTILNHLRIVVTINFLHVHNQIMSNLAEAHPVLDKSNNKSRKDSMLYKVFLRQQKKIKIDTLTSYEFTSPWTSKIVIVESMCLLAAIEHAGNFSVKAFSNPWT